MIDEVKEDVNRGWARLKTWWGFLTDEAKYKIISAVLLGVLIGDKFL